MQLSICGMRWINRSDPLNLQDFEDLLLILIRDVTAHPQGSSVAHTLMGQSSLVSKEEDKHNHGAFQMLKNKVPTSFGGYWCSTDVYSFFSTEMMLLPGCLVWKNSC